MRIRSLAVAGCAGLVAALGACSGPAPAPEPADPSNLATTAPAAAELRALLAQARYRELEGLLESLRQASLRDVVRGETPLVQGFAAFEKADNQLLAQIEAWVESRPRSYQAHTARAHCLMAMAYDARGSKFIEETKPEQVALMRRFLAFTDKAVDQARRLQESNIAIHRLSVVLGKFQGREYFLKSVANAVEAAPNSYSVRVAAISGLQPRWYGGKGDYSRIEAFVRATARDEAANPRFRALRGYPSWARGQDLINAKNYDEAIAMFTEALSAGEDTNFLEGRYRAAAVAHKYDMAIRDARRAEELEPWLKDDPDEQPLETVLAWARHAAATRFKEGKSDEAIAVLGQVLAELPDDTSALVTRGGAQCRARRFEHGAKDLRRALSVDPESMLAHRTLAACLVLDRKVPEAIQSFESYVLKVPGNAAARVFLASLYADAGDYDSAMLALDTSCKLGYADACGRMEQVAAALERAGGDPALIRRLPDGWAVHEQERIATIAAYDAFVKDLGAPGRFAPPAGAGMGKIVSRDPPVFPSWAASGAPQGWVEVQIYFNPDGTVAGAVPVRGNPAGYFELAAVTAALRWRSEPSAAGWSTRQRIELKARKPGRKLAPNKSAV